MGRRSCRTTSSGRWPASAPWPSRARRALYAFVASEPGPVSREQAAEHTGLALHSVRFHLDRLVEEGLLDVEFRRLSGRSGPGAGRPAKLSRRSDRQLSVSIPDRRYDVVGDVLAEAVDRSAREGSPVQDAVLSAALTHGRRLGAASATTVADAGGSEQECVAQVLAGSGYEPRVVGEEVVLANCPFDRLARDHTEASSAGSTSPWSTACCRASAAPPCRPSSIPGPGGAASRPAPAPEWRALNRLHPHRTGLPYGFSRDDRGELRPALPAPDGTVRAPAAPP